MRAWDVSMLLRIRIINVECTRARQRCVESVTLQGVSNNVFIMLCM
jgi:hypothetical protein